MISDDSSSQKLESPAGATQAHPALPLIRPLILVLQLLNRGLRWLSSTTHRVQGAVEGRFDRRRMWFDHYVDLHHKWLSHGDAMFLERGMFNRMLLRPGADVLEIACGDGFYTCHFYGPSARSVLAIDIDPAAIAFARHVNARVNVRYQTHDIRLGLPEGSFTHVIWDGAMMFLTEEQLHAALAEIRARVGQTGRFTGYAEFEPLDQPFVRHPFPNSQAVAALLKRHFEHVLILTTEHPERINFYFLASDSPPETVPVVANATT